MITAPVSLHPMHVDDIPAIIQLSLAAWAPVFQSFETVLGTAIYHFIYPDWRTSQAEAVESVLRDEEKNSTWVAVVDGEIAGFVAYQLNQDEQTGEIYMLAVHPDFQNRGIGTALNHLALEQMRIADMKLAVVGTGGDPGHAPARRSYEKAGFTPLPIVRYYQKL